MMYNARTVVSLSTHNYFIITCRSAPAPISIATSLGDPAPRVTLRNDFVCLAMLIASQSDSSFVKRHEKITSMVWSDQSDSRFTAGSLALLSACVVIAQRPHSRLTGPLRRLYQIRLVDSNFPVESLATRD